MLRPLGDATYVYRSEVHTCYILAALHSLLALLLQVCEGCEVTAYAAGHVLGAAILHLRVGGESVVYSGEHAWLFVITAAECAVVHNATLPVHFSASSSSCACLWSLIPDTSTTKPWSPNPET